MVRAHVLAKPTTTIAQVRMHGASRLKLSFDSGTQMQQNACLLAFVCMLHTHMHTTVVEHAVSSHVDALSR